MPYFTLVIPTYNRSHLLERALRTCIAQSFAGWEAVVVDDASSDPSAVDDVVRRLSDSRIRFLRHERNQGVCPARNTAVGAARGTWLVFHDDDDELMPDGLELMHDAIEGSRETDIHRHVFAYRDDWGRISPEPPLADGAVWDYRGYLEWVEQVGTRTDFLNVIRRDVFDSVLWPTDQSREAIFHLELARRFRTQCHAVVAATIHADAADRLTAVPERDRLFEMAPQLAAQWMRLLDEHGSALEAWAPRTYARFVRSTAINSYIAGQRGQGLRYAARLLRGRPFAPSAWGALLLGLLPPRAVGAVVAREKSRRARG
ncbi:MAG TPA: glycosyltransferase family 2 protein [Thermoanaerobaculia bacterium]|jgi:glycosyltransferase involved in cell wall biosynthesis